MVHRTFTAVMHLLGMHQESGVHLQPKSNALSGSNEPSLHRAGAPLIAGLEFRKIALMFAFVVAACSVDAQTYNVGPDASKGQQAQTSQTQSSDQPLGWGSNIQNARLARAAQLALQQGNHALALDYAQRAAQAAPNDPQLWFLLGYAARLDGKYGISAQAYERGMQLKPSSIDGLSGLAQTYSLSGRTADAERLLKQVIAADPRRTNDLLALGNIYVRTGDYQGAIDTLGRAERQQPSAQSELLLAVAYEHLKNLPEAGRYLQMAKNRAPGNPDIERSLAGFYRDTADYLK